MRAVVIPRTVDGATRLLHNHHSLSALSPPVLFISSVSTLLFLPILHYLTVITEYSQALL